MKKNVQQQKQKILIFIKNGSMNNDFYQLFSASILNVLTFDLDLIVISSNLRAF